MGARRRKLADGGQGEAGAADAAEVKVIEAAGGFMISFKKAAAFRPLVLLEEHVYVVPRE